MADDLQLKTLLGEKRLKITKARKMILDTLINVSPQTTREIYASIQKRGEAFSLSTIYRNCEILTGKGLILKSNLLYDGGARYEYLKTNHTHRAICLRCNKIFSIDENHFDQFDQVLHSKYDFDVKSYRVEIYGYCHNCRRILKKI